MSDRRTYMCRNAACTGVRVGAAQSSSATGRMTGGWAVRGPANYEATETATPVPPSPIPAPSRPVPSRPVPSRRPSRPVPSTLPPPPRRPVGSRQNGGCQQISNNWRWATHKTGIMQISPCPIGQKVSEEPRRPVANMRLSAQKPATSMERVQANVELALACLQANSDLFLSRIPRRSSAF